MKKFALLFVFIALSCSKKVKINLPVWETYDEISQLETSFKNDNERLHFKLIQSKNLDKNTIFTSIHNQLGYFNEEDYQNLMPLILDQDIRSIQKSVEAGTLNYENLTKWYLYRILKFESQKETYLNAILSINPKAVEEAQKRDANKTLQKHPIFGMPILLKDNINTEGMPTTAGTVALKNNITDNAFLVDRIVEKGGIILGKANLSEWAYFICDGCPSGYSALGGQTLNPYGRILFDTGGSSSGSGVSVAANYAVAAVGSETSGSIISPSSQNSLVGLKPTIGKVSRTGIIHISSTLDTAGPMAKNIRDAAILLSAMVGEDKEDASTSNYSKMTDVWNNFSKNDLKGKRLGVFKGFLENEFYKTTVEKLKQQGAEIIEIETQNINFEGFVTFLNADMKEDLPKYLKSYSSVYDTFKTVDDVVAFNKKDSLLRIPYNQVLFDGIVAETISKEDFEQLKNRFHNEAISFFETPFMAHNLDAIVSINNYNSGHAAMAKYPCLTVPMAYKKSGEPIGVTFIARPLEEEKLLKIGYAYEQLNLVRKSPEKFK